MGYLEYHLLPNNKIFSWPKFEEFTDMKYSDIQMIAFVSERVEKIDEKQKMLVSNSFFFCPQCFQQVFFHQHSLSHCIVWLDVNPLPNKKFWPRNQTESIGRAAKVLVSLFDGVENIVGKGENAGYQHFLLTPQCFQKAP